MGSKSVGLLSPQIINLSYEVFGLFIVAHDGTQVIQLFFQKK